MLLTYALLSAILLAYRADASPLPALLRRKVLADGSSMQSGKINEELRWQSSGRLETGCGGRISNCYTMTLASSGQLASRQLLDASNITTDAAPESALPERPEAVADLADGALLLAPMHGDSDLLFNSSDIDSILAYSSPRQRIELLSWPPAPADSSFHYTWSTYLESPISTSNSFFHLWQLFSREEGGPAVSLTATKGKVAIDDNIRDDCGGTGCPQVQMGQYTDKVVKHDMKVTFGQKGRLQYSMTDAASGATMLKYSAKGYMGQESSLKFGLYRATVSGMSDAKLYAGAYSAVQL